MKFTVLILTYFSYISFVHCLQVPTAHPSVGGPKDWKELNSVNSLLLFKVLGWQRERLDVRDGAEQPHVLARQNYHLIRPGFRTFFILRLLFTGRTEGLRTVVRPVTGMHLFEIWEALLWTEFRVGGGGNAAADDDDYDEDNVLAQRSSWYGIATYLVKEVHVLHEAQRFVILRQVTAFLTAKSAMRTVAYIVPVKSKHLCNIL